MRLLPRPQSLARREYATLASMPRTALPAWAVNNRLSVAREAAPYRDFSPAQRAQALAAACRAATQQAAARPDAQRLREYRDPLPESSRIALRRLRAAARKFP